MVNIPWLVDVVGHRAAAEQLTALPKAGPLAGQQVKVRRMVVSRNRMQVMSRN